MRSRLVLVLDLIALVAVASAVPPASAAPDAEAPARPNLLLLVAEDLGPRIGAFGDRAARTPVLDRLAAQGVRFSHAFTTAGVCAPSRAALVTGMHQIAIGAQHMRTGSRPAGSYRTVPPPQVKAFPERLRAAGYYTFVTAKLDYQFSGHGTGSGPFTVWDAEDDETLWQGRDPGQPFFGMVNFLVTHETGIFPPLGAWPHSLLHAAIQVFRAWRFGWPSGETPPASVPVPPYFPDTPTVRADLARHYDNIAQMDRAVGALLERLEADGLADSTIVIWTTDHGDGLPRAKRDLFDAGIRVPLIVRWPERLRPPRVVPGAEDGRLVSMVDLAPTLLALAGLEPPRSLHGRDFLARDATPRRYVYAARDRIDEVDDRQRAVRDDRFKYIRSWHPELAGGHPLAFRDHLEIVRELRALHEAGRLDEAQRRWFEPVGEERLFDTRADPHELRDLSDDPAHAAVLVRMRDALDAWLERVGDWSEVDEDAMVEAFWPEGVQPVTPPPEVRIEEGCIVLAAPTPGASLGYRVASDRWRPYTGPFAAPRGARVEVKAVRYGWADSETLQVRAPEQTNEPSCGRLRS